MEKTNIKILDYQNFVENLSIRREEIMIREYLMSNNAIRL